jgi:DNA-binding response OmpR family regulator
MSLPSGTRASSQQKTVLIIEDDPHLQEELSVALVEAGYRVRNAYDGDFGLRMVFAEMPDLVVLDLILPKKDGFKVLREMKWRAETKDIPVIVLSNLENSDNIELAIRLGAKSYLAKSNYTVSNIVEKVRGILGEK